MTMRVTFAGSGDAFGSGGRFQACILVDNGRERTLIDCGATSLVALRRLGIDPNTISQVVVSHLHGDHFGGLPFLVIHGQLARREEDLEVIGPRGTEERLQQAMEVLYPGSSRRERRFAVRVREVEPGVALECPGMRIMPYLADHPSGAPAHMYRLEAGGRTIAYTGDTAWTEAIVDAAGGADLLIAEALFRDKHVPYHLDVATLSANRGRLQCERIVLTHMDTDMLDNPPKGWECAYDGMVIDLT